MCDMRSKDLKKKPIPEMAELMILSVKEIKKIIKQKVFFIFFCCLTFFFFFFKSR